MFHFLNIQTLIDSRWSPKRNKTLMTTALLTPSAFYASATLSSPSTSSAPKGPWASGTATSMGHAKGASTLQPCCPNHLKDLEMTLRSTMYACFVLLTAFGIAEWPRPIGVDGHSRSFVRIRASYAGWSPGWSRCPSSGITLVLMKWSLLAVEIEGHF